MDSADVLRSLGDILVDNLNIRAFILVHALVSDFSGLFQGLKIQQANIREQGLSSTEQSNLGLSTLILQDVIVEDSCLSDELSSEDQTLIQQLTSLKIFQSKLPQTSYAQIL